jgi:ATP-dependent Lon protease
MAMEAASSILLVAQKSAAKDEPGARGHVRDRLRRQHPADAQAARRHGQGAGRGRAARPHRAHQDQRAMFVADGGADRRPRSGPTHEIEAMRRAIIAQFDQYVKLNKKIPPEILTSLAGIEEAGRLADTIAAHLPLKLEQKQEVLEMFDVGERLEKLLGQLETELDILQVEKRIRGRVKRQMEKSQREYYLNEQVKAIQKELGEGEEGADLDEMEKKIKAAGMSKEAARRPRRS